MPETMHRRDLMKIASAALLGVMGGQKNWAMPRELVQNVAKAAGWTPVFLNAHQNETVVVLTNLIIPKTDTPGANEANVHCYIDLFLSVSKPSDQKQFTDGLAWVDNYANQTYKLDFVKCSADQQTAILNRMAGIDKTSIADMGHAFFNQAKNMTAGIYFSTPEGYKELNKLGAPPTAAGMGCAHAGSHT